MGTRLWPRVAPISRMRRGLKSGWVFFIQAANDYSIRPTLELAKSLEGGTKIVQSKIYPAHGLTSHEGHLFESTGQLIWGEDVRAFLERYL